MKFADEYLGSLLCFLLTLFGKKHTGGDTKKVYRNVIGQHKGSVIGQHKDNDVGQPNGNVKNILLVKFWGMGSIILTTPALKNIRKAYPGARIYYLTLEGNREICSLIHEIDEVTAIKLNNPVSFSFSTIKKIFELRNLRFDLVFDFEFFTYYSALIAGLIKPKYSSGFSNNKNNRNKLFSETVGFNNHLHTRDNFLNLVSSICGADENTFPPLKSSAAPGRFDNSKPIITVNPNASRLAYERRLPASYFVKIIESVSLTGKYNIILTGSADETKYVSGIYNSLKNPANVTDLSGRLSVKQLAQLISSSACLITNDSGPLHLASLLNKPVIAFYGPESPEKYGPLSTKQLVFYRMLECSPCMSISNSKTVNCIYSEPKCMTGFDIEEIIFKTGEFVNSLKNFIETSHK